MEHRVFDGTGRCVWIEEESSVTRSPAPPRRRRPELGAEGTSASLKGLGSASLHTKQRSTFPRWDSSAKRSAETICCPTSDAEYSHRCRTATVSYAKDRMTNLASDGVLRGDGGSDNDLLVRHDGVARVMAGILAMFDALSIAGRSRRRARGWQQRRWMLSGGNRPFRVLGAWRGDPTLVMPRELCETPIIVVLHLQSAQH